MAFRHNPQHKKATPQVSKILGIQFSILSPEEIEKGSVVEITSKDMYANNRPCHGGLFDPRMGVLDPGLICPTDGMDYMNTPGYFGHIQLARPVFYIQYLPVVLKILRCVCMKCSKLLIDKNLHRDLMRLRPDERWSRVYQLASKVNRCGKETEDGCGCLQPDKKYRKDGLANIFAEWTKVSPAGSSNADAGAGAAGAGTGKLNMKVTPEMVIKIFKRISNEDVEFMGFSPQFSRPEWMVCQVLAIPPPAVRPSIKMDGQQRSEDDITHILVNIVKTNEYLKEQLQKRAAAGAAGNEAKLADPSVIDGWHTLLQYYVATQVNNNIPGVGPVAQRSGRPLKSIQERLNGKGGRVRGNLMGKRVDFSARSVITPDPNISIRELGIPVRIAKNITKPVVVNDLNRDFLMALVKNRSEVYPGAKILEKVNGQSISLRYADVSNITLENGDIVHRHMMDGDAILFNRQPSLHRMSMMCHIARIMHTGDTFRMNVGDTKPYNADFDGDEMNMHMPQDEESELELRHLAAVPYQIISPAKNESIIGIFQDSLLGSFLFTREKVDFTPLKAMGLLVGYNKINGNLFKFKRGENDRISNFQVLSQIMPPLSMRFKNGHYDDTKDQAATSNRIVEIKDGEYTRGQIEKSVLASCGNGLIQRICNDFGNTASADFIDNLQNIVTEYMKSTAYSVGISDLMSNADTNARIAETILSKKNEVKNIIDQVHLGIFENTTGRSNLEAFETKIANILNTATNESGSIGLKKLNPDNRFVTIVKCGSKGTELNISQMISCLGQQSVDGGRIPYGLDGRTLPHFTKFDDGPSARGFIDNSFISGLTPEELFFHAMGGRIGLIDTAVKTSSTGYIQRRLVKGLEDLMVCYDMTVRNNKGRIVQFTYGDDGIDTIKVERANVPFLDMCVEELYAHYSFPTSAQDEGVEAAGGGTDNAFQTIFTSHSIKRMKKQSAELNMYSKRMTEHLIRVRDEIIENVFRFKHDSRVYLPVGIQYVISNTQGMHMLNKNSMVDITPLEAFQMIQEAYSKLEALTYSQPTQLFRAMYFYHLSPRELLMVKRFNRRALTILLETIVMQYKRAVVAPGEMVGMIAAQSIGEPTTQLTLNTFHNAGVASKANVTRGVPRIEEILSLSDNPKNPSITIYAKPADETDKERVQDLIPYIEHTRLVEVVASAEIRFDPNPVKTVVEEDDLTVRQYNEFEKLISECHSAAHEGSGATAGSSAGAGASSSASSSSNNSNASKWIVRLEMDAEAMLDKRITMDDVHYAIKNAYGDMVSCVYSDYNADKLVFRIRLENIIKKTMASASAVGAVSAAGAGAALAMGSLEETSSVAASKQSSLDQSDHIYVVKTFRDQLLNNIVLRGVKDIGGIVMRKVPGVMRHVEGNYAKSDIWVMDTMGTNLMQVLALDSIDVTRTVSNDIQEIYRVLGIEAARVAIMNELMESFDSTYINHHHLSVLCDRMTANESMVSIFRHGINSDNIGPIAKASFEETPEMFLKAARHAEVDNLRGVSSNVMCGQEGYYGTSSFSVLLNLRSIQATGEETPAASSKTNSNSGESGLGGATTAIDYALEEEAHVNQAVLVSDEFVSDMCTTSKLEIVGSNGVGAKPKDLGAVSESYDMGF
jgi:DNA-directed RNA polymerase II subunit RPB1